MDKEDDNTRLELTIGVCTSSFLLKKSGEELRFFGLFDRIEGACHPRSPVRSKVCGPGVKANLLSSDYEFLVRDYFHLARC
jgi:hypothetical protein